MDVPTLSLHDALSGYWPAIEREMARMERLVGQLLELARKEGIRRTDPGDRQALNLSRIVREAAAAVLPLAEETGRPVEVEAPEVVPVRGVADDLRDMRSEEHTSELQSLMRSSY